MHPEQKTCKYMNSKQYFKLSADLIKHGHEIITITELRKEGEDRWYAEYVDKRMESNMILTSTNLGLGASVTASARTRLHKELNKLGDRVIYCLTDSCVYEHDPNKYNIPEGYYLGEWESETPNLIHEWVSAGAKSYGYKYLDKEDKEKIELKQKGVTLNVGNTEDNGTYYDENLQRNVSMGVSFESMKQLVLHKVGIKTKCNTRFQQKKDGIYTDIIDKRIEFTADKREKHGNTSYPYGYKGIKRNYLSVCND
jgi:hypothetical protein